jgi:putative transposase
VTPALRRELVAWAQDAYQLTDRRACRATGVARSSVQYRSRRPPQAPLRDRLRELARNRVSSGYRRLHVLLRREGWGVNVKRVTGCPARSGSSSHGCGRGAGRAWPRGGGRAHDRPEPAVGDGLRARRPRERREGPRAHRHRPAPPRVRGAGGAAPLRRRGRGAGVRRGGARAGRAAAGVQADQGTEFTSVALDRWAYFHHVELAFSRPGTPGDNAHCEAFTGTLRREVLSQQWFASLAEAQHVLDAWRTEYNDERPTRAYSTNRRRGGRPAATTSRAGLGCLGDASPGPRTGSPAPAAKLPRLAALNRGSVHRT